MNPHPLSGRIRVTSSPRGADTSPASPPARDTRYYAKIFLGLSSCLALEVVTTWVAPFLWPRVMIILSLAAIQGLLLAMNIMNLRWEKGVMRLLFLLGVTASIGLVLSLLALFYLGESSSI